MEILKVSTVKNIFPSLHRNWLSPVWWSGIAWFWVCDVKGDLIRAFLLLRLRLLMPAEIEGLQEQVFEVLRGVFWGGS